MKNLVYIVEDHPIFSMGIKELINQEVDLQVCGIADNADQAFQEIKKTDPHIVIVDLSLKSSSGIDLIRSLNHLAREIPILVLSMHDEAIHAERCILAGAKGYIMKQEASDLVIDALRHILAGNIHLSPKIMNNMINRFSGKTTSQSSSATESLSDRELEVLTLIGQGLASAEIAEKLFISAKTVGTYRERLKEKLNLKHGAELVRYAVLWVEFGRT